LIEQHPFVNDELANRILCGSVIIKPNVKEFTADGHGVIFDDGSKIDHIDCVLMATGFNIAFPYLDETILPVKENRVRT
jgi:dimethylaniline monooxygenase (N-oxide forming)